MTRSKVRKPNIRDISRQIPTQEEYEHARNAMSDLQGPPLVVAILGASLIEHELEQLLRPRFTRRDDTAWGRMTNENGPLATFSQKIMTAYAMGIVDKVVMDGMGTVKDIRNQFAHAKKIIKFDHPLVVKELKSVTLPTGKKSKLYANLLQVRGQNLHSSLTSFCACF